MMKLIAIIIFVSVFFLHTRPVNAQPVPDRFTSAYQTYQESISNYRDTFDDYILARSQYIKFKTLQAEKEARDKTIAFLEARDQVVIDYLELPKIKLDETEGIDSTTKTDILVKIEDEISWHESHKSSLKSALTLDEIIADSNEAKTRYSLVQEVAYLALSEIAFGNVEVYSERFDEIFNRTKIKLDAIKSETREEYQLSDRQKELVDRWVLETETRKKRAEELTLEIRDTILKKGFKGTSTRSVGVYNEMLGELSVVIQHLDEGGRFIQEIVRIIKTKD